MTVSNNKAVEQIKQRVLEARPDPHVDGWHVVDLSDLTLKFDEGNLDPAFPHEERAVRQQVFFEAQALVEGIFEENFYGFGELTKLARVPANLTYKCYRLDALEIKTQSQSWGTKTYQYAVFADEKQRKAWQRGK